MFSCETDNLLLPNNSSPSELKRTVSNSESNRQPDLASVMESMHEFAIETGRANADEITDFVNGQMALLGNDNLLDSQELDDIMSEYMFVSTSNTLKPYLEILSNRGKISKKETKLLFQLDTDLFSNDRSEALNILTSFKSKLKERNLSSEEKLRMENISTLAFEMLQANSLVINNDERGWRECLDCLHRNDIKIGFFAAITVVAALAFCSGAAIATFGLALYPCLAITLGIILAEALIFCGGDCFSKPPPECNNPTCPNPDVFVNNVNNGFQCCTDFIEGITVLTHPNGTIYLSQPPVNGNCPPGWIPDGIFVPQCLQIIEGTWENLTVAGGQVCADAICN